MAMTFTYHMASRFPFLLIREKARQMFLVAITTNDALYLYRNATLLLYYQNNSAFCRLKLHCRCTFFVTLFNRLKAIIVRTSLTLGLFLLLELLHSLSPLLVNLIG